MLVFYSCNNISLWRFYSCLLMNDFVFFEMVLHEKFFSIIRSDFLDWLGKLSMSQVDELHDKDSFLIFTFHEEFPSMYFEIIYNCYKIRMAMNIWGCEMALNVHWISSKEDVVWILLKGKREFCLLGIMVTITYGFNRITHNIKSLLNWF